MQHLAGSFQAAAKQPLGHVPPHKLLPNSPLPRSHRALISEKEVFPYSSLFKPVLGYSPFQGCCLGKAPGTHQT